MRRMFWEEGPTESVIGKVWGSERQEMAREIGYSWATGGEPGWVAEPLAGKKRSREFGDMMRSSSGASWIQVSYGRSGWRSPQEIGSRGSWAQHCGNGHHCPAGARTVGRKLAETSL